MSAHVRDLLLREREDELEGAEEARLRTHLDACADCREFREALRRNDRLLSEEERVGTVPPLPLPAAPVAEERRIPAVTVAVSAGLLVAGLVLGLLLGQWRSGLVASPAETPPPVASPTPTPIVQPALDPRLTQVPGRMLFLDGSTIRLLEGGVWTDVEPPSPVYSRTPFVKLAAHGERVSALISDIPQVRLWSKDLATGEESLVDLPFGPQAQEPRVAWSDDGLWLAFPRHDELIVVGTDGHLVRLALEGRKVVATRWLDERSLLLGLRRPDDPPSPTGELLIWRQEGIEVLARGLVFDSSFLSHAVHPSGPVAVATLIDGEWAVLLLPEGRVLARINDLEPHIDDPRTAAAPLRLGLNWSGDGELLAITGNRRNLIGVSSAFVAVVDRDGEVVFVFGPAELDATVGDERSAVLGFTIWGAPWNEAGDALAIQGVGGSSSGRWFVVVVELDGSIRYVFDVPEDCGGYIGGIGWGETDMLAVEVRHCQRAEPTGLLVVLGADGHVRREHLVAVKPGLQMSPDGDWARSWPKFVSLLTGEEVELEMVPRGWVR